MQLVQCPLNQVPPAFRRNAPEHHDFYAADRAVATNEVVFKSQFTHLPVVEILFLTDLPVAAGIGVAFVAVYGARITDLRQHGVQVGAEEALEYVGVGNMLFVAGAGRKSVKPSPPVIRVAGVEEGRLAPSVPGVDRARSQYVRSTGQGLRGNEFLAVAEVHAL